MRSLIIALGALAFATSAEASISWGGSHQVRAASAGYHLDRNGSCHAADGRLVAKSYCAPQRHGKTCSPTSKPCGNDCIPKDKVCHVG